MNIFIICPVHKLTLEEAQEVLLYVQALELLGYNVHYPPRDTEQDDPIGLRICRDNCITITFADEVHVWYNPSSSGSHFDLGVAFALDKPIKLINKLQPTDGTKSFNNVLIALDKQRREK